MSEKRFRVRFEQEDGRGEIVNEKGVELTAREVVGVLNEQQDTISALKEENEQLKYNDEGLINEEMTNMECLLLLIPFGILFVLLTGIIIAFLVQLGWVVI